MSGPTDHHASGASSSSGTPGSRRYARHATSSSTKTGTGTGNGEISATTVNRSASRLTADRSDAFAYAYDQFVVDLVGNVLLALAQPSYGVDGVPGQVRGDQAPDDDLHPANLAT